MVCRVFSEYNNGECFEQRSDLLWLLFCKLDTDFSWLDRLWAGRSEVSEAGRTLRKTSQQTR